MTRMPTEYDKPEASLQTASVVINSMPITLIMIRVIVSLKVVGRQVCVIWCNSETDVGDALF